MSCASTTTSSCRPASITRSRIRAWWIWFFLSSPRQSATNDAIVCAWARRSAPLPTLRIRADGGQRRIPPRAPSRCERPREVMPVALEQEAALAGCARGIEPRYRLVAGSEHAMLVIDREPTLRMHKHRAHRSQRHIGSYAELRPVSRLRIVGVHRGDEGGGGHREFFREIAEG